MSIRIGDRIISGNGGAADGESLINQNTSSSIEKVYNWVGTLAEYEEQDVANAHPDWVCYILDDEAKDEEEFEVYEISGRNVGDIFFTSRKDINLSGAVECDGSVYSLSDYEGVESVEELLKSNKLPYVSISEYNTLLETNGSVGVFGWDGINASTFRVPTLNEVFIESGKVSNLGEFIKPGLPNITGTIAPWGNQGFPADQLTGAFVETGSNRGGASAFASGTAYNALFDASRSSSIYGNSTTVQPQSVCYRPMVQLATGIKEESIYNIENHALFDNRITNCITHIPQDIKLELNSNILAYKAGSKFYIPNGFEEDGTTRHFDEVILESDLSFSSISRDTSDSAELMVLYKSDNNWAERSEHMSKCWSGDTQPTVTTPNNIWYDTANNVIKITTDTGATWNTYNNTITFPLCGVHITDDVIDNIDQIFNGFGFIGNATFVLPGVIAAFANGFNEDGTYKNTIVKNQKVNIRDLSLEDSRYANLFNLDDNNLVLGGWGEASYYEGDEYPSSMIAQGHQEWWYNTLQNKVYATQVATPDVWKFARMINIGTLTKVANANITEFKVKKTLKILNYNNTEYVGHQAMPSDKYIDLTLGSSGTSYTAPADGYVKVSGTSTEISNYLNVGTAATQGQSIATLAGQRLVVSTPVKKGDKFTISYQTTSNAARFTYIEGSK